MPSPTKSMSWTYSTPAIGSTLKRVFSLAFTECINTRQVHTGTRRRRFLALRATANVPPDCCGRCVCC